MRIRFIRSLLLAGVMLFLSTGSFAQVGVSVQIAPPELPVYDQPICPGDGFIWTPGYWGWGGAGFIFNEGYWGPSVGFYGGIDYGFGYFGHGYEGGRWRDGHFFYNTAVNRVDNRAIHNVYNEKVTESANRVSYNGGNGGINKRATSQEEAAARGKRVGPVAAQTQHAWSAHNDPQQRATRGAPGVAATARPNVVAHPKDLPPVQRSAPNTGNPKLDQKYQQQQDKVIAKQNQDRQKLQQKQDNQHQQLAKQNAAPAKMQQVEQQHQQQTQRMAQSHTQQMQRVQQRQQPAGGGSRGGGRR